MATREQVRTRKVIEEEKGPRGIPHKLELANAEALVGWQSLARRMNTLVNGDQQTYMGLEGLTAEAHLLQTCFLHFDEAWRVIQENDLSYVPVNWPRNSIMVLILTCLKSVKDDLVARNKPDLLTLFPAKQDVIELGKLIDNIKVLKKQFSGEPCTTASSRTSLAILMGWGLAGGYAALPLYSATPPSIWQLDHCFIERRMRAFMNFLEVNPATFTDKELQRNVRYVRDTMNTLFLQRADQKEQKEVGCTLEVWFLNRGKHGLVTNLFTPFFGPWLYCPFCLRNFFSQTALSTHLPHCASNMKEISVEANQTWLSNPANYCILQDELYHCVLCDYHADNPEHL